MKKLYFLSVSFFLGVILITYLYFSSLSANIRSNNLALNEITEKSALVFNFDNDQSFYDILKKQNLLNNLLGQSKNQLFGNLANAINTKKWQNRLQNTEINIGFVPNKEKVDFIINLQLNNDIDLNKLTDTAFSVRKTNLIYEIHFKDNTICYARFRDKILSLSNNPLQLNVAKQNSLNRFAKYIISRYRKNKNALANLYINFNKINTLVKTVIAGNINGELRVLNAENAYASLSYNFSKEKILFSGYTSVQSDSSYYHLFTTEKGQKTTIDAILPLTTANYTFYGIDNYSKWAVKLNRFFKMHHSLGEKTKEIEAVKSDLGVKLEAIFPKYFKKELITFQLSTGEKFGAIALNNGDKTEQLLMDLSTNYAPEIQFFKRPYILYYYFGDAFKNFDRPYYTIVDNYMVVANDADSMQTFLNAYKNNQLLIHTDDYKNYLNQLSSLSTITFYVNIDNSIGIFNRQLKNEYFMQFLSVNEVENYDAFSYQLSADDEKFATNLLILTKPKENTDFNVLSATNTTHQP